MEEIIENGYNLNIPRYVDTSEDVPDVDLSAVASDLHGIDAEIDAMSEKLRLSFKELGIEFPF
jgi:type I restriction enzyme M protein